MTTATFMQELRKLGVELRVDRDSLVCNAPKGVLTPALQAELAARKAEFITFLQTAATVAANDSQSLVFAARDGNPPLSFAQERLWYLDELESGTATYNLPSAVRLNGPIDIAALRQSMNDVVRSNEILRTRFAVEGESPVQIIDEFVDFELPLRDLSDYPTDEREIQLEEILRAQAQLPFDLAQGPLFRAICFRLCEQEHVLFFMAHHTVFDGSSFGILLSELAAVYGASVTGEDLPLAETPVQYADYAIWQRKQLDEAEHANLLDYWTDQLSGELPVLQMPVDRPRPPVQSHLGATESIEFSAALVSSLTKMGRSNGATPFMVLLAAFNVLLHRYTNQDDFIIGSPINGRNRPEFDGAIGFFVNTIALRTDVSGDPTFRDLLQRVKQTCIGAYGHQELPFEKLVQALDVKRDLSRTPLFQSMFAYQDTTNRVVETNDMTWTSMRVDTGMSRTDLSFWLSQSDDGLNGVLEYSSDLFDQATIARLLRHYENLLEAIVSSPDEPISRLPVITDVERQQILVEWNATEAPYSSTTKLHELFEGQAKKTPQAIAVSFGGNQLSYADLNRRANQLAHYLRSLGVTSGMLVAICLDRSIDMLVGLLGILKAGGAYVPLDPDFPAERLAYMLDDADISLLLTRDGLREALPKHDGKEVCLDTDETGVAQQCADNPEVEGSPDDLAYVIYTSGSTGQPKGVRVPHRGVVNFLGSMRKEPGIAASDSLLAVTTLSFDIAVLELFLPLTVGARVVIASRDIVSDGEKILAAIEAEGISIMQATPATWQLMIEAGWKSSAPLKVLCGGETMLPDLAVELLSRATSVWNLYGPTETTIWSTCSRVGDHDGPVLIGKPIANTQVYVVDRHMNPVPVGVAGELCIGGAGVTHGYVNQAELTADRFSPNNFTDGDDLLYRTGDLARWRPDGSLEHLGRIDSQVKVRGFRIELGEIESVLSEYRGVDRVAVNVWDAAPGDQRLVAYLVLSPGETMNAIQYRKHLGARLPGYMLPQHYVELEQIPLTPNGKVDRKQLPAPTGVVETAAKQPPVTGTEKQVATIWSGLLGIEQIGRHDNFFELGGHSLLAVKAVLEIEKATGTRIELRHILLEDLYQIAEHLESSSQQNAGKSQDRSGGFFRRLVGWSRRS